MKITRVFMCSILAVSSVCQAEEATIPTEQAPQWMLKVGADIFNADNDLQSVYGTNDLQGYSTNVEGTLYGGTVSIGRVVNFWHPAMLTLDLSKRSGDLTATVTDDANGIAAALAEVDREDQEAALTYQIVWERFQPFLTLAYWDMEQSYYAYYPLPNNEYFEFSSFNVGAGLGVNLGQVWKARLGAKASGEIMLVDGKWTRGNDGSVPVDDNTHGFRGKGTLLMNIPFKISSFSGGIFAEGGYQYQRVKFDQTLENNNLEMEWDGFYGRTGIFVML